NLNAIGLGLKAKEHIIVLTNTADMLMCTPYFLLMLTYGQRLFNKFLPPFCPPETAGKAPAPGESCDPEILDFNDYRGIFSRPVIIPLLGAVGISVIIFAVSFGVYSIVPKSFNMAALMLAITTLGIGASLVPRIRNIKMSFHLGQYIILIFCLVVGSLANLKAVLSAAPGIIIFTGIVVYGCLLIHVLLAAVFRIDTDTVIITSIAAVFSPPFVPVVATALKNREVIISGITTGILGWVIGNYLGIGVAYFLKGLFGG
ncbi:MAG TPA: DUF819 family protein, partial [Spirochaetes bacterium]|nr:DUF819 family protein [Spirochaetota bacterium]